MARPLQQLDFMQPTVEITFREMCASRAVETAVGFWVGRLARTYDRIDRCHVWIEAHRGQRGPQFTVRVVLGIPGQDIAASHGQGTTHRNINVAIADAFIAARRQLHDFVARRRDRRIAA